MELELAKEIQSITRQIVETRYPVHWPTNFSYEEAKKSLQYAERIRSFIKARLSKLIQMPR
jgi:HEPN domain-containing protein